MDTMQREQERGSDGNKRWEREQEKDRGGGE